MTFPFSAKLILSVVTLLCLIQFSSVCDARMLMESNIVGENQVKGKENENFLGEVKDDSSLSPSSPTIGGIPFPFQFPPLSGEIPNIPVTIPNFPFPIPGFTPTAGGIPGFGSPSTGNNPFAFPIPGVPSVAVPPPAVAP